MGIYIKGISIPKDRDMEIVIHPDGAARVEVKEDYGVRLVGTDAINIKENRKNWDCYWAREGEKEIDGEYFPEIFCNFDGYSTCELCEPCRRYVRRDKIDDYIRHLLKKLDYYYKLP